MFDIAWCFPVDLRFSRRCAREFGLCLLNLRFWDRDYSLSGSVEDGLCINLDFE